MTLFKALARWYSAKEYVQEAGGDQLRFIVAAPRSGTTWMQTALNSHPDVYCAENRLFGKFAEIWPNNDGSQSARLTLDSVAGVYKTHVGPLLGDDTERRERALFQAFLEALLNVERELSGKPIIVDKITPYIGTTDVVSRGLEEFFPSAKVVHLVRDGRDVLVSGFFHWINRTDDGRRLLSSCDRVERLLNDEFVDYWSTMWTEVNKGMAEHPRVSARIRYEELITDFEATFKTLLNAFSLRSEVRVVHRAKSLSAFTKMSGGRERGEAHTASDVRKGVVGDWKNWFTRKDAERFWSVAGDTMKAFGYEKDASWIETVPTTLDLRLNEAESASGSR